MFFFKRKNRKQAEKENPPADKAPAGNNAKAAEIAAAMNKRYDNIAQSKEIDAPIPKETLLNYFSTYFAPNFDFYMQPGSPKYTAYFNAVNQAKTEMLNNPKIFTRATKWTMSELKDLISNPVPGLSNSLICGLIYRMGEYAVIKDSLYCVDFSERIPNCIGLYLLLTAHREPPEQRKQQLDIGDGVNKRPLAAVLQNLSILDPDWKCRIVWPL